MLFKINSFLKQDKINLAEKLKMVEQDDTMKRVMEELQSQNQLEKRRLSKVFI